MLPLPPVPYEACDTRPTRVTSLSLVRYRRNDYSVPTAYGHRDVVVKGYVDVVVIVCGSEEIARHRRSYGREELIFDPPALLGLVGAQDGRARSSGAADRVGAARRVFSGCGGSWRPGWAKPGPASMCRSCGSSRTFGWPTSRGAIQDALRLGAIGFDAVKHLVSVPPRPPAAPPRPGAVSASPGPAGDDDHGGRLLDAAGGRGRVMAKSTLLLDAHLKALRLPTFLREYDKVARHCAQEGLGLSHATCFRLCELELLDREQRAIERRIKAAKFPGREESRGPSRFRAIPVVEQTARARG